MGQRQGPWLLLFWADGTGTSLVQVHHSRGQLHQKRRDRSHPEISQAGFLLIPLVERTILKGAVTQNCSPSLNMPCFPLPILPHPDIPVGRRLAHFVEQWEELTHKKLVLSVVQDGFRIPFRSTPPLSSVPISLSQPSSHYYEKRFRNFSRNGQWKGTRSGNSRFLFSAISCPEKEQKVSLVIDLSLLNQYTRKQPFKIETVKLVRQSILVNEWTVSVDLRYLPVSIYP